MELEFLNPLQPLANSFHDYTTPSTPQSDSTATDIDPGPAVFFDSPVIQETYESLDEEFEETTIHEEATESSQSVESSESYEDLESEFGDSNEEELERVGEGEEGEGLHISDNVLDSVQVTPDPDDLPVETVDNTYDATLRFSAASWFNTVLRYNISILGIGGIGSHAALAIARLFPGYITLYDYDSVDRNNLAGQLYKIRDINCKKVYALRDTIREYCPGSRIYTYLDRITSNSYFDPIVVCGFDNMEARRAAYNAWLNNTGVDPNRKLFIDARLSAEYFQIFCFTGEDTGYMKDYEENWLFPSSEAEATSCSYKQTTFASMILGGIIANLIVNFANNNTKDSFERSLPYMITYDAELMQLKYKN